MEKQIGGKRYNTETAKKIGVHDNYMPYKKRVVETLYRKNTGEFFLHCLGEVRSRYARFTCSRGWEAGELLIPIPQAEAVAFIEEYLPEGALDEVFNKSQSAERKMVGLYLSPAAHDKLKQMSSAAGMSASNYVEFWLINAKPAKK